MKQLAKYMLILVLTIGDKHLIAQDMSQALIDSLLKELPKQKEDTNKANLLYRLSYSYCAIDPEEGIKYGRLDSTLSTRLKWKKGIAEAYKALGANFGNEGDYANALHYDSAAIEIFEETGNKTEIAAIDGNIGIAYDEQGDYPKALKHYLKAIALLEETGQQQYLAIATGNTGNAYFEQGNYPKALEYYLKALKMHEAQGNKRGIAFCNGSIGLVYNSTGESAKALRYYLKTLKIYEEIGDKRGTAISNDNIGGLYIDMGDYQQALEYCQRALTTDNELGFKKDAASSTINLGNAYSEMGNHLMAIAYNSQAFRLAEETGDRLTMARALSQLGYSYLVLATDTGNKSSKNILIDEALQKNNIPSPDIPAGISTRLRMAANYSHRALDTALSINAQEVAQGCYADLSTAYKLMGNFKKALNYHEHYTSTKDSIFSKDNAKKIVQHQMKYDYEKKEDSLKLVSAGKEKEAALKLQRQRSYTLTGVGGIVALAIFSFFIFRNNKLLGKEKKRSDDLLLNILPAEVANELKEKNSADAKQFDHVTVLFTDFVNFTQTSESMSAQALIDELHACFKVFDEITTKYHLEKIKTIGDAYLTVAGLPVADVHHAEHVVQAANEIVNFMEDRYSKLGDRTFRIRAGINSGSVVAGIVGVKKFAYDIWGDTVNTAARMEQNSAPGRINISETSYELVKNKFDFEYRGEMDAKGKGIMKMYYLV